MHLATRRGRRSALQQLKISAETALSSSEVSCRRRRPRSSAEAVLASTEGAGRRQPRKLTCVECSAEFGSFGSYLGSSPLCPCHRKSPCHRSSPRRRRRSKPQVAAAAPSDVLSALPSDVVHAIVLACDGVASLAWCGSCKHFRACRPPLRVLVVGRAGDADIRESHPELRHLMAVHVSAGDGARAHSCIDALPAALASEVTHLFVAAWRKASLDLAPERLPSYGLKYSALRCLALAHRTRGSLEPLRPTPAACAKQLICATAATLRALSIDAPNGFEAGDAVKLKPHL
mmetsp:Transcript_27029/g.63934  ORF Transcript_27029/g.63934 Transcript_27029/m.63934 type:complete len:289 (-) Transcript_27029:38-904(-)